MFWEHGELGYQGWDSLVMVKTTENISLTETMPKNKRGV